MPQLEFIDCQGCGKRVAKSAKTCHHCQRLQKRTVTDIDDGDIDTRDLESHHASEFGGYNSSQDEFDYDEFLSNEFGDGDSDINFRNRWKYVSILMLLVFIFLLLIQFL